MSLGAKKPVKQQGMKTYPLRTCENICSATLLDLASTMCCKVGKSSKSRVQKWLQHDNLSMPTKTFVKTTAFPVSQSNRSQKENHKGQVRCFSCLGGFTIFPRLDATITPKDLAAAERKLDRRVKRRFWIFLFSSIFQFLTSLDQTILRVWWSCKSSVICSRCFRRTYLRRLLPTMQTFLSLHRSLYHWAHLSTSRSGSLRFGCSTTFHVTWHVTAVTGT